MTRRKQNKEIDDDLKSEDIAPPLKSECLNPIIKQQVEGIINSYLAPPVTGHSDARVAAHAVHAHPCLTSPESKN